MEKENRVETGCFIAIGAITIILCIVAFVSSTREIDKNPIGIHRREYEFLCKDGRESLIIRNDLDHDSDADELILTCKL